MLCPACNKDMPTVQNLEAKQQHTVQEPIEIVISHGQPVNTIEDLAAHAMQEKLQSLLGDQAHVILYADYQMGSGREQIEAMQLGRIHITIQPASEVSHFIEDMKVFLCPYLFPSNAGEVMAILDGALEQDALDRIGMGQNESMFTGLGLWFGGYKLFTFHGEDNKTIHSPADFQGLKIAVPDASLVKAQYQSWGAEPVVTDMMALYSTLAQHLADGSEATLSQIASNYLYEVQHNIVQAYHSAEVFVIFANAAWFSSLSESVQTAVMEAEQHGRDVLYEELENKEVAYLESICQAKGMHYEVLNEKEQEIFKSLTAPIYTEQLAGCPWQINYVQRIQEYFK